MQSWEQLDAETESSLWDWLKFQALLGTVFPHNHWLDSLEFSPSITYSVTTLLKSEGEEFQRYAVEVNSKLLGAFRQCLNTQQRLYALDWQHQCYWFSPHDQIDIGSPSSWPITFFPYGDFHFFLTEDFSRGTFGHPWKETLCVFGRPLINLVQNDLPTCFQEVRRKL